MKGTSSTCGSTRGADHSKKCVRPALPTRTAAVASWDFAQLAADRVRAGIDGRFPATLETAVRTATDGKGLALACLGSELPTWDLAADHSVRLVVPAGVQPLSFQLIYAPLAAGENPEVLRAHLAAAPATTDLTALTGGGPALWPERLPTQVEPLGASDGPFVVDDLTLPNANPWRSWLRCTAFDFFADGDRAAICSWQGDVWLVQGLRDPAGHLQWQRIASGLFQPLGLKIVAEQVYVLGRDQITRLHDLNGDNETDYYENFNNDAQVTEHFHEFAMDLQTDAQGEFYYMKAARHALPAVVPQHGTLIHVARDGLSAEILAGGFRAPDGLLVNGDGTFFTSDQEGHWTPMNRINLIRPGGFYGNMMAANPTERLEHAADLPVCWIHREIDRSPTAQIWVREPTWGPLQNALLSLSYGTGKTYRILMQEAEGTLQGGIVQLPVPNSPLAFNEGDSIPMTNASMSAACSAGRVTKPCQEDSTGSATQGSQCGPPRPSKLIGRESCCGSRNRWMAARPPTGATTLVALELPANGQLWIERLPRVRWQTGTRSGSVVWRVGVRRPADRVPARAGHADLHADACPLPIEFGGWAFGVRLGRSHDSRAAARFGRDARRFS